MNGVSVMPIVGSDVFELCIFSKTTSQPEYVGYYDDATKADKYIADHQSYDIFLTPQYVNPSLTQRGHNTMVPAKKGRTKTDEVLGYRYLLIDLDPRQKLADGRIVARPSGVSSTDEEHLAALTLAKHIISEIGLGDENYLLVDSGNGYHVYIPVELGIQRAAIEAATKGIKMLYETEMVEVDESMSDPAQLMRAPGSINNKGAIKRPVVYLHCPEHIMPVNYEFVAGLKIEAVQESQHQKGIGDMAEKAAAQIGYITKKPGPIYVLKECPFCHSTDKGAVIGRVGGDGGYFFKCHHKRCVNKKWADLKDYSGLATSRLDTVRKVLKEQGSAALELPEVQAEVSKLKALGELHKLQDTCKEVGIEYITLKKAARKPFAIAQDLADEWIKAHHIKTDKLTREIYYYQDGIYVDATDFVAGLIDEKFRGINTTTFINNVTAYLKRHSQLEFTDEWLGIKNGLLNPTTLERVSPTPDIVTRVKLNVTYDPEAKCPEWLKFLGECQTDVALLQETAGYPLLPGYPHQKAIMLIGIGGQGKSVFLRVVSEILGIDNISAAALQSLIENRFATSDLYGRLANVAGDLPDMALSSTGTFKALTGDDRIRAEKKGQDAFDFWNRAKLIFSTNQLPPTKDKSLGYMRRWVLIDFDRPMVQTPNPHLAADLLAERSGIFNWMLEGAKSVSERGFNYTNDPEEMGRKYIERSEPVVKFLEACCEEDFDSFMPSKMLFAAYNKWATENKKKRMGSKEFINAMRNQTTYSVEYHRHEIYRYRDEVPIDRERPWGFSGVNLISEFRDRRP